MWIARSGKQGPTRISKSSSSAGCGSHWVSPDRRDFTLAAQDEDRRAADLSLNSFLNDRRNPSVSEFDREKDTMTVNGHTKVTKTGSKPTSPPRFPACASLCAGVRNTLPNVQRVAGL